MGNKIQLREDITLEDIERFMRRETSKVFLRKLTAIRLIMKEYNVEQISDILMVTNDYVYQTANKFRDNGIFGLEDKRQYNGQHRKLTGEDILEIKKNYQPTVITAAIQQQGKSSKSKESPFQIRILESPILITT